MNGIHATAARHGFTRPTEGRIIGGVCAGIARHYSVDAWAVRWILLATLVLLPGTQFLIYPIVWLLMPADAALPVVPAAGRPQDTPRAA